MRDLKSRFPPRLTRQKCPLGRLQESWPCALVLESVWRSFSIPGTYFSQCVLRARL
ncbi:hypothetical protein LX32DRAFT_65342 [Colletotrichum zoysiae]|uniref:Uncharacterized protein n=1 Tax=Colletotrichum zoysiae TaxID=1216348 RepID=A0AAD9LY90_9PEZI|nr:hypothetical protein LX32DRAFT_65342 [Colletotrichum zoysiae]